MIWKIFLIFWEEAGRGTWNGGQGYRARKMEQEAKTRRQAKCDRFALIIGKITWKYAFFDLCGNIFFLKSCFCRSCRNSNSHKICFFCRAEIFFAGKMHFWAMNICIFSYFISFLVIYICILSENVLGGQFANWNWLKKRFVSEFTFVFSQKADEAKKMYLHFLRNGVGQGKSKWKLG